MQMVHLHPAVGRRRRGDRAGRCTQEEESESGMVSAVMARAVARAAPPAAGAIASMRRGGA